MRKGRFTPEQLVGILQEAKAGGLSGGRRLHGSMQCLKNLAHWTGLTPATQARPYDTIHYSDSSTGEASRHTARSSNVEHFASDHDGR